MEYGKFEELRARLIDRRIVKWDVGSLTLDDGTELDIVESAVSGESDESAGGEFSNVTLDALITNVSYPELEDTHINSDWPEWYSTVTIFHNQNAIALANFYANAGNCGYYYSVSSFAIKDVHYPIIDTRDLNTIANR